MNRFSCLILLLMTSTFSLDSEAGILSDKEYGYLFHYPENWIGGLYRSGFVLSEANSRDRESGFQVRIRTLSVSPESYVKSYVSSIERSLNASLISGSFGYKGSTDYYEMNFDSIRNGKGFYLYNKLIFFPDQKRVLIVQAGCLKTRKDSDEKIIKDIAKSLWVYNANKLAGD